MDMVSILNKKYNKSFLSKEEVAIELGVSESAIDRELKIAKNNGDNEIMGGIRFIKGSGRNSKVLFRIESLVKI